MTMFDIRRGVAHRAERGFTLIEILVVLAIVAFLAIKIFGFDRFLQAAGRRDVATASDDIKKTKASVSQYMLDCSVVPSGINQLWVNGDGVNNWDGPYMTAPTGGSYLNPWGNAYELRAVTEGGARYMVIFTTLPSEKAEAIDKKRDGTLASNEGDVLRVNAIPAAGGALTPVAGGWGSGNVIMGVKLDSLGV